MAGSILYRQMLDAPHATAIEKLKGLQDSMEHEKCARKHEKDISDLTKEYSILQTKKSITDADYSTEKVLLAREFKGHLERRLRAAAYDLELNRVNPSEIGESGIRRQMFVRDLKRNPVTSKELLGSVPDGGYVAPVFTKESFSYLPAEKDLGHYRRNSARITETAAASKFSEHFELDNRESVSEGARLYGRPFIKNW